MDFQIIDADGHVIEETVIFAYVTISVDNLAIHEYSGPLSHLFEVPQGFVEVALIDVSGRIWQRHFRLILFGRHLNDRRRAFQADVRIGVPDTASRIEVPRLAGVR